MEIVSKESWIPLVTYLRFFTCKDESWYWRSSNDFRSFSIVIFCCFFDGIFPFNNPFNNSDTQKNQWLSGRSEEKKSLSKSLISSFRSIRIERKFLRGVFALSGSGKTASYHRCIKRGVWHGIAQRIYFPRRCLSTVPVFYTGENFFTLRETRSQWCFVVSHKFLHRCCHGSPQP